MSNTTHPRIAKLVAMVANCNNGVLRMDCLSDQAVRLFGAHKAEAEAAGVLVFTEDRVYTPAGYAAMKEMSDRVHAQHWADVKAAREAADQQARLEQHADFALNALLARAEAMTMTS